MRIEIRPAFDDAVMSAELPVRKAAAKMLLLLQQLDLPRLWTHPGLNFEKLHGMVEPVTGQQLYSLRVTQGARAISCLPQGPTIVLVQHDKAYTKKAAPSEPSDAGGFCHSRVKPEQGVIHSSGKASNHIMS